ncbi:hypothetical protein COCMIDRAFT_7672 [Bipolaris oryzae ATCC 44560]|uniref:Uncharacterized protein n=1 Tax=Bipolaris oryzae ATCC 44560 TaxID=930090 RepID=W6ZH24_COCMI|nr:uncharacterized protein COCMIDRAFT_7672 [Bipolaris oryzae ATCC 44560]EUC42831.1 hypothetical protein COCMIDRAFT_7672 [Bipolaris oryzae ATCC 44560]
MLGFILQNDVFLAAILNVVLNFPGVRYFWDPAVGLTLAKQRASIPRVGATQIATLSPEPTILKPTSILPPEPATFTPISTLPLKPVVWKPFSTLRPEPVTLTETVTLIVDATTQEQQGTAWAHYPTESAALPVNPTQCCTEVALYEPKSKFQAWTGWAMLILPVIILSMLYLALRSGFVIIKLPAAEGQIEETKIDPAKDKKSEQEMEAEACGMFKDLDRSRQEMQRLIESVEKRDAMLECLGIFKDNDTTPDEESLKQLVKNRKKSLEANEDSLRKLQAEKIACLEKIQELEAEKPKMVEDIKNQFDQHYAQDVNPKYQESLNDKDFSIQYWRNAFFNNEKDEAMEANYRLCEEKEAELAQLRTLPAQISDLEQALHDATKQIETLQQEKKDQGIADRRRWMLEKDDLCKKHNDVTEALKAELKEAKQLSKLSKETSKAQQDSSADATADKKQAESLKKEHEAMMTEASELRKQIEAINNIVDEVVQDSEKLRSERDGLREALEKLEKEKATEKKATEEKK